MFKNQKENSSNRTSCADLLPDNVVHRSKLDTKQCASAPSSTNVGRLQKKSRTSLGVINVNRSETDPVNIIPRDCIAWQTMSQQLTLQLEQKYRSQLAPEREDHTAVIINEANISEVPSVLVGVEFDENTVEDTTLLKMDAHIIPLEKLIERFNSDLTNGLSNDIVTQHRATYGQNKLTQSRPPSLLWMFLKQLFIGFNGVLWIAALFAFLCYVSSLLVFLIRT